MQNEKRLLTALFSVHISKLSNKKFFMIRNDIILRPETPADFPIINELVPRAFAEHTGYSDGADEVALIEEIRRKPFYRPELSFAALLDDQIVGHFMFSEFPLSPTPQGGYDPLPNAIC